MDPGDITALLTAARTGDADCQARLFDVVYRQLRSMAAAQLRNERPGHTLQPSALVNEAYLRLLGRAHMSWENRAHFFSTAAGTMRRILIDHARTRRAQKRDGALKRMDLDQLPALFVDEDVERLLMVDAALKKLAEWDERQAKVVELRFFAGLTTEEIAQVLSVSERTVKRDWSMARAWLVAQLGAQSDVR
jgi:RNA polymerase sigma-70 factor, ECF subfamily